jgi:hypothetical protein
MSNIFEEVVNDANAVQNKLLGPTYPYYKNINTPTQIGMSDKGTIQQMGKDINGLIQYVELLVSGNSQASSTGGPLGNRFFLQTGAKCAAIDKCSAANANSMLHLFNNTTDKNDNEQYKNNISTCQSADRFIYVNNIPNGNIPFISSGLGVNFTEFKGLIPGAMSNLNVLNPYAIMRAFMSGSMPPCQEITMQTIDTNNNQSSETHYVTLADISSMDACTFSNGVNPVTGATCKETFQTGVAKNASPVMSQDPVDQLYFATLATLGLYIFYRFVEKSY